MRVLFITPRFPGDLRRGDQLRAYQHLRALSTRHSVTLLTFDRPAADKYLRAELEECCESIIAVKLDRLQLLLRTVRALFGALPLQTALYMAPALRIEMERALREGAFDVVHVQLARLGTLVSCTAPVPCVLDLVDALSINMRRRSQYDHGPMRHFAALEAARLATYERELCAQASVICASAAADGSAIGVDEEKFHLVSNGVDLEAFAFDPSPRQADEIVFTGNLGYFPNIDAAMWLAREVMPLVVEGFPAASAMLVGARPARSLRHAVRDLSHMRLVGAVERMQPYLARARVAVAPMRAGSGQQIKILEAMAIGTPVVATRLAAKGMDGIDGVHLLVADSAQDFAHAVLRLLKDRGLAQQLARNARSLVEKRYSWQASACELERAWIQAAGMRGPDASKAAEAQ